MNSYKEIIKSNIAGLNPTGTLDFKGTFILNGPNNIIQNSSTASKSNLQNINNNKVVCSNIENFINNNFENNFENNIQNNNNYKIFILTLLFIILVSFIFIFLKK
jgi:hypothetical protein